MSAAAASRQGPNVLQQYRWHCNKCTEIESLIYSCETCFTSINIFIETFTQCKQCFKILHKSCVKSSVCLTCLPISIVFDDSNSNIYHITNDFYNGQPYFSPFEFYSNEIVDFVPDAEVLSERLQHCSEILRLCDYYTIDKIKSEEFINCLTFVGLNVDGFKSNFDTFLIDHNKLTLNNPTVINGYFMCETNVTESESEMFYIPGYNKFVLDKLQKENGKFKQKGSGVVIFLNTNLMNVKTRTDLNLSTIDFEALSVLCAAAVRRRRRVFSHAAAAAFFCGVKRREKSFCVEKIFSQWR